MGDRLVLGGAATAMCRNAQRKGTADRAGTVTSNAGQRSRTLGGVSRDHSAARGAMLCSAQAKFAESPQHVNAKRVLRGGIFCRIAGVTTQR
jgi:hypothetical protein